MKVHHMKLSHENSKVQQRFDCISRPVNVESKRFIIRLPPPAAQVMCP